MLASRPYEGVAGDALTLGVPSDPKLKPPAAGPGIPVRRRAAPRTLVAGLVLLAAALVALGLVDLALMLSGPAFSPRWVAALYPVVAWIYLAAGIVAWLRRPSNRLGPIMVAGAGVWIAAGFVYATAAPGLIATGLILATVPLAIVVHLLHAFPSGRLHGSVSRATVLIGYAICLVLQAPLYLFMAGPDSPWTVLRISERPELAETVGDAQTLIGVTVMIVTTVILARRLRRAAPAQQRVLAPLSGYAIATVVFVALVPHLPVIFGDGAAGEVTQLALLAGVPVAFAVGLLRGGFARTGELQELAAWLGSDHARPALADALADALGDPSLELLFPVPGTDDHVDFRGRPVALPPAGSGRGAVDVMLGDRRVGAIVYDATLIADRSIVESAGRVVALALHNEQLTAELRAGRDRLQRALARTVEASDVERRRIARDLHDGLQGRLVLLAIQANAVRGDPTLSAEARSDAAALGASLQTAITELRDLVQGVMPAMLTERGLCAAAEELAERCPIPVVLDLDRARGALPGAVESTGYFLVAEALANVVKHARAGSVELRMTQQGGVLRIELRDDGIGGAHANGGAGLRGMADRVEALDGRLTVRSPPGGGTGIDAELPCAS
jgi:signal transduction histidine kinase